MKELKTNIAFYNPTIIPTTTSKFEVALACQPKLYSLENIIKYYDVNTPRVKTSLAQLTQSLRSAFVDFTAVLVLCSPIASI